MNTKNQDSSPIMGQTNRPSPSNETNEPTREQLLTDALLNAQNRKWDGWNWKEYQKAIVRLNWHISKLESARD